MRRGPAWSMEDLIKAITAGILHDGEFGVSLITLRSVLLPGEKYAGQGAMATALRAAVAGICTKHGWSFKIGNFGGVFEKRRM